MHNVVLILIGLIGAARLIATGQAALLGTVALFLAVGFFVLWLAVKAWVSVR